MGGNNCRFLTNQDINVKSGKSGLVIERNMSKVRVIIEGNEAEVVFGDDQPGYHKFRLGNFELTLNHATRYSDELGRKHVHDAGVLVTLPEFAPALERQYGIGPGEEAELVLSRRRPLNYEEIIARGRVIHDQESIITGLVVPIRGLRDRVIPNLRKESEPTIIERPVAREVIRIQFANANDEWDVDAYVRRQQQMLDYAETTEQDLEDAVERVRPRRGSNPVATVVNVARFMREMM